MKSNTDILEYYAQRAKEYEKIYNRPKRQKDLKFLARTFSRIFRVKSN